MKKTYLSILFLFCIFKVEAQQWDWATHFGEPTSSEAGICITSDHLGNIYVAGNYERNFYYGTTKVWASGTINAFVAKHDSAGNVL